MAHPMDRQGFLDQLGRRLRRAREERGLALAEVARRAGVSRRTLTEAEAGRANPSAIVLARLAEALDRPLAWLMDVPLGVRRPNERIALVGLRGAGKSTVGRKLARELEVPFVELDLCVEDTAGLALAEIFALHGEEGFHRFEAEALEGVLAQGERVVLAAGGSIVNSAANFARLCAACRTIWLCATPKEHFARVLEQGDARPMRNRPRAMEELASILERREPLYSRCASTVDTTGRDVDEVVAELVRLCRTE